MERPDTDSTALPESVEELHAPVRSMRGQLAAHAEREAALEAELDALRAQIARLEHQLAPLRRRHFGRRSEKLEGEADTLELALEEFECGAAALDAAIERGRGTPDRSPAADSGRGGAQRRPLPDHLPRDTHRHEPPGEGCCSACGGALGAIGEDVAEVLEYVPGRFRVVRHVRPKYRCGCCRRIVQQPAPPRPIERCRAGPALLAHVAVAKYADHLPLYRQSRIYAREGVALERSTLADWVGRTSRLLRSLDEALGAYALGGTKVHADDTSVPVLEAGRRRSLTPWARPRSRARARRPSRSES